MRYMTHQFAHIETLERAMRWLVHAGIDRGRIEAHKQGILRLAVAVEAGESAEVQRIIDVAESSDPDGNPSIWSRTSRWHLYPQGDRPTIAVGNAPHSQPSQVGWHPQDGVPELSETDNAVRLQRHYQEGRD
jgi:hypothetical protein